MKLTSGCRIIAFVLSAGFLVASPPVAIAQGRLALAVAAGPSPYDLSGTGTGTSGAAFLAWRGVRGLVVEPGLTVFSYRSQFDERTSLLFPELSMQGGAGARCFPAVSGRGRWCCLCAEWGR
jgi:hypothetical protein